MKEQIVGFSLSKSSEIVGDNSPQLHSLIDCVKCGGPIVSRNLRKHSVKDQNTAAPYVYCETSGTTGNPRTIRRRPITWIRSFEVNREMFALNESDIYAVPAHLDHSLSLYAALEALHIGADVAHLNHTSPKSQVRQIKKCNVTVIYATPSQLYKLLGGCSVSDVRSLNCVRHLFVGGGKLHDTLRDDLLEIFPNSELREFYGSSETSFVTITDANTPHGSVGKPYPGVSIRIGMSTQQSGSTQEIWVDSPYLFDGYETADKGCTRRDGNFVTVGDAGQLDSEGCLFLTGRTDRMFTVADNNIYPEAIEQVMLNIPGVTNCVVLPMHDAKRANVAAAVVEGNGSAELEKQIKRHCRKSLHPLAVPRLLVFLEKIPMLPSGKPDAEMLRHHLETRS